jgi:hypothetical protein
MHGGGWFCFDAFKLVVNLYCDMKGTKDALLIEEVHSLR